MNYNFDWLKTSKHFEWNYIFISMSRIILGAIFLNCAKKPIMGWDNALCKVHFRSCPYAGNNFQK